VANSRIYRTLFQAVLVRVDPETAHTLVRAAVRWMGAVPGARRALRRLLAPRDDALRVHALGLDFPGPVGLAAGFDKDADCFQELTALGFGFVEVGTVTALAQHGSERPRLFRLPADRALVNRMGFNNPGAPAVAERLHRRQRGGAIVGVNVGRTRAVSPDRAIADYRECVELLAPLADYVVLNVSSPNTPGLRELQAVDRLAELVAEVRRAMDGGTRRRVPLLVKVAPELSDEELDAIADLAVSAELDGIVAVNTTTAREGLRSDPGAVAAAGDGGLSGAPLGARALEVLRRLRARVGDRLVLVSVGGVETPEDAWERIRAGATLVQGYTGFVYGGPLWPYRMHRGLARLVREAGMTSIQQAVGAEGAMSSSISR